MCAAPGMKTTQLAAYLRNQVNNRNFLYIKNVCMFHYYLKKNFKNRMYLQINVQRIHTYNILRFCLMLIAYMLMLCICYLHMFMYFVSQGKIYAIERNEERYNTLCDFVERTGSKCVETLNKDSLEIKRGDYDDVEYILLDPSCSGSGELSIINSKIINTVTL